MADEKLRILCIGAHHDDCEIKIGGTAILWADAGHAVRFVSATDGQTGHHELAGAKLSQIRMAEAKAAAEVLGVQSQTLPITNGHVEPSLANRRQFITLIRSFAPDLVITHRPNDYHPDHRYTSQLVQDSAYLVTVPNNVPETPPLRYNPVICYCSDHFVKPIPFQPEVVIDIGPVIERKFDAIHRHGSQMYEWIPWNQKREDQVPESDAERRAWLFEQRGHRDAATADRYRDRLIERYGQERGRAVKYAEAFEGCEYGSKLDTEQIERLFGGM